MSLRPLKHKYSAILLVTDAPGREPRLIMAGGDTEREADEKCAAAARVDGWTAPRWWQWWRRKDSKTPLVSTNIL